MSEEKKRTGQFAIACGAALFLGGCGGSVEPLPSEPIGWDTTKPRGNVRTIDFQTDSGTWMSVDISPDGQWLVFDLLANVYRVPITGGEAACLTQDSGIAVNFHPRISPDGTRIAFISDRAGHNNLWVMNADGTNPRLLHAEPEKRVTEPVWEPDGKTILAQRSYNGNRWISEGIWRYDVTGGPPEQVVAKVAGSPAATKSAIFYHTYSAGDPKEIAHSVYVVERLDTNTGEASRVAGVGMFAPQVSPAGNELAYVRRYGTGASSFGGARHGPPTNLWVRDLESGEERLIVDDLDPDIAETGGDLLQQSRLVAGFAWSEDGKSIVFSRGGRLNRVDVASALVTEIPFRARVFREISEQARTKTRIAAEPVRSRFLRWTRTSPDGSWLAFQAFGRIWLQNLELPDAPPRRLTGDDFSPFEYTPAWSPDGQWLAFAAWDPIERGSIWKIHVGSGETVPLARGGREFLNLDWSPDGQSLVAATASADPINGRALAHLLAIDVVTIAAESTGPLRHLVSLPRGFRTRAIVAPNFDAAGRIWFTRDVAGDSGPMSEIRSLNANGKDMRHHATVPYAEIAVPSPDGRWIAFKSVTEIYLLEARQDSVVTVNELPYTGGELNGVRRISPLGGLYPRWVDDRTLEFVSGNIVYRYDAADGKLSERRQLVELPRRVGAGVVALKGARVIALAEPSVLENADIVIRNDRITCVGQCETESADLELDLRGKTVMPGIVDLHNTPYSYLDLIAMAPDFKLAADMAYGVTTAFSPSSWSEFTFPLAELVEIGQITGPRLFTAADKFRWDKGPYYVDSSSYESIEEQVRKTKQWGAVAIKQYYRERNRAARQQVVVAARENDLAITAHLVKGLYEYGISMAMDGYTGAQHTPVQMPFYSDASEFFAQAQMVRNSTVGVAGGVVTQDYYLQRPKIWANEKARRYLSPGAWARVAQIAERPIRPKTEYGFELHSKALNDIVERGGYVSVASHGEFPGLSPHIEIWILADKMGPLRALQSATLHGARFLGAEDDIGSLEKGKIADLVVLNSNPLDRIENTQDIAYVVKAGRIFDGETLDELWPEQRTHPHSYW